MSRRHFLMQSRQRCGTVCIGQCDIEFAVAIEIGYGNRSRVNAEEIACVYDGLTKRSVSISK